MTREEAIEILKNAAWLGTNEDREQTEQAVDMAIKALSQEPCDDAISREDAITAINKLYEECEEWRALNDLQYGKNQGLSLAIEVIDELPPVTQKSCEKCNYKIFTELYFHTDPEMKEGE